MRKVRSVQGRTPNQKTYIRSIIDHDITFCHGPAGTGKTHIAAGMAAGMLQRDTVEKIALCRPVVSCGQDIGFLPGSIGDKIGTYLAPLFDELGYYIEVKDLNKLMSERVIEIIPLSMMRGRSFNKTFVILDEAQNATYEELRMLLTRVGKDSKMVLAGDSTQSDTPGLAFDQVTHAIENIDEIGVVELTYDDIVRNSLIRRIITALDRAQYATVATNDFKGYEEELH